MVKKLLLGVGQAIGDALAIGTGVGEIVVAGGGISYRMCYTGADYIGTYGASSIAMGATNLIRDQLNKQALYKYS